MTITLLAGRYAIGCLDDMSSLAHEELEDQSVDTSVFAKDSMAAFTDASGRTALIVDAGVDDLRQEARAIPFAGVSLFMAPAFEGGDVMLAVMPINGENGCIDNPCAPGCLLSAEIELTVDTVAVLEGRTLTIGNHRLDLGRVGIFTRDGDVIDMADPATAAKYDYANVETSEHGIYFENDEDQGYLYFGGMPA